MKKIQYLARNGRKQWRPVFNKDFEALAYEGGNGFCVACGEIADSFVEPDARKYKCHACGEMKVYGLEELAMMGLAY